MRDSFRLAALAAALLLAGVAMAAGMPSPAARAAPPAPGVVILADGRSLEGEITEADDRITVNVNGIVTIIPRSQVQLIEYGTPEERLRRRLELLGPADLDQRLDVADEALRRRLLDLAQEIAADVRRQDPRDPRAQIILEQVDRQRQLQRSAGRGVRTDPREAVRTLRPTRANVLDDEQINRIRQAELQDADARAGRDRPRISFREAVVRRFVDAQPDLNFREFNQHDDVTKALYILRGTEDPDLREDVRVTSHPVALLEYLRRVEPVILNGCATSACHGGAAADTFALYADARDEATSYTNFYLLSMATAPVPGRSGGAFGEPTTDQAPVEGRLIDRSQPDQSLLLHYMLPPESTGLPHPQVRGFKPLVQDANAEHYQMVRRWIAESLTPLPQPYGFEFQLELPGRPAAGEPDQPQQDDDAGGGDGPS